MSPLFPMDALPLFRRASRVTLLLTAFVALIAARVSADEPLKSDSSSAAAPVYPFAMCSNNHFFDNKDYPLALIDAGARMVRVDEGFNVVRRLEGDDPDGWSWSGFEKLRALRGEYPQVSYLPILGYCPAWAAEPGSAPSRLASRPRGIEVMPATDPKNLYGNFVYEAVKRYKDINHDWESWNEPDLPGHHYFTGGGREFFAVQKSAYLAAKAADPQCNFAFAGLSYATVEGYLQLHKLNAPTPSPPVECFFEDFLKECVKDPDAKKNHYYFDVMNQHSYSRATDLYDYPAVDRKLMTDYLGEEGKTKPIWITEMGINDKGPPFGCSPDEYCDYILQSYAWGKLAGVQRFFHFQLDNTNGHGLYYGMPAKPKPALITYRDVLVKEFAVATAIVQIHGNAGVSFLRGNSAFAPTRRTGYDAFEFQTTDGRRLLMAFADTDEAVTVKLPARASRATLIDRHNKRSPIEAKEGFYEVILQGATNVGGWPSTDNPKAKALGQPEHLIGGATIVIVEPQSS